MKFFFFILSFLMGAVVLVSNYLVQFPIQYLGLEEILTYGAFSYPIAFLITDLANRSYGKTIAKKIVYIGFAIGIERLLELIDLENVVAKNMPHVYLLIAGDGARKFGLLLAEEVRNQLPNIKILTNCGDGSLKNQFKKADKSGAEIALILGENELERKQLTVKYLRDERPQLTIRYSEISNFLSKALSI